MILPEQAQFIWDLAASLFADRPKETVSEWCERCFFFDEPDYRGPFSLIEREYCREPLDNWADPEVTDMVLVWGSQSAKTGTIMGGSAWTIVHEPSRLFWVMPTQSSVHKFSKSRWIPALRASPALAKLIPAGNKRNAFTNLLQFIGNSIVDLVWSNSPSALASVPARVVVMDECDKFAAGSPKEADAISLAEARTKKFPNPKRVITSTPTTVDGLIWQRFLQSDQRRRFLPCPHCKRPVLLAWSKDYTVFKLTGKEAFARWDPRAKRKSGEWDLDQVAATAHYHCPHCAGQIRDAHKTAMDRDGKWEVTNPEGNRRVLGYHLPSLYASSVQTNVGAEAIKFLQGAKSLQGLQYFITNELAEPWQNQETRGERIEIIAPANAEPIKAAVNLLTADYQLLSPKLPYVARAWKDDSRLLEFGFLETFEELREAQQRLKIQDNHVCIDSGHDAQTVYDNCLRFGVLRRVPNDKPIWVGWTPAKGFDRREEWRDKKTGAPKPWRIGWAALPHGKYRLPLLEFSTNHIKDIFERLRSGKTRHRWEVTDAANDEYWIHLDADIKGPIWDKQFRRVRYLYKKRTEVWPDHLRDCELEQLVMALLHRCLNIGILNQSTPPQKPS